MIEEDRSLVDSLAEISHLVDVGRRRDLTAVTVAEAYGLSNLDPSKLPPVVGLTGSIGAGKTEASRSLMSLGYRKVSFAAPLKAVAFQVFGPLGVPREAFFGTQEEKSRLHSLGRNDWATSGRTILELVGTNGFRSAYPSVWLDLALVQKYPGERLVVDDLRYDNEAEEIRARGGSVIHLARLDFTPERTSHVSDSGITRVVGDKIVEAASGDLTALRMGVILAVLP